MNDHNCCHNEHGDGELTARLNGLMPDEQYLYDAAELLKVFGDPTRVRIIFVLRQQELCVCDIANALNMTQSAISHQLRVLKQARLVKNRRDGKTIYYSIADDHVCEIFCCAMEHVMERNPS